MNNRYSRIIRPISLCALLLLSAPLHAGNSVSNTTTHATFVTVTDALAALNDDGQTLIIAPGIYTEPELIIYYAVTLQGEDAATAVIQPSAIAGTAASRVATVNIAAEFGVTLPVVFDRLTLRHGKTSGHGGALYVQEGSVLLTDCVISNNVAGGSGGALFCQSGTDASLAVEDTIISRNIAGGQGGGVMRARTLLRCTLTDNRASDGGGAAYATLEGCALSGNQASGQGGGLYLGSATRCTVRNNSALFGGGVYAAALANTLLTGNAAGQSGGGLYLGAATNCTLIANIAGTAGGGLWGGSAINSVFYDNQAVRGANYTSATTLTYSCAKPLAPGNGNIDTYPRFRNIDTGDYSLLSYSPCVNAGTNGAVLAGSDLGGDARVQDGAVDMGAYEHNPAVVDYTGFSQWLQRNGLPIEPATQFALDIDEDGIPNGFAFAFGANRIDGALLSLRHTPAGVVAETAVQHPESQGFVNLWVEATGALTDTPIWSNAVPVATGAPEGALRFRRDAVDATERGFFRLKAALP